MIRVHPITIYLCVCLLSAFVKKHVFVTANGKLSNKKKQNKLSNNKNHQEDPDLKYNKIKLMVFWFVFVFLGEENKSSGQVWTVVSTVNTVFMSKAKVFQKTSDEHDCLPHYIPTCTVWRKS